MSYKALQHYSHACHTIPCNTGNNNVIQAPVHYYHKCHTIACNTAHTHVIQQHAMLLTKMSYKPINSTDINVIQYQTILLTLMSYKPMNTTKQMSYNAQSNANYANVIQGAGMTQMSHKASCGCAPIIFLGTAIDLVRPLHKLVLAVLLQVGLHDF